MYKFVDLHCDTITKCLEENQILAKNNLQIDLEKLNKFKGSLQVFAIWLKKEYYKNAFEYTNKVIDFYEKQLFENRDKIEHIKYTKNLKKDKLNSILAIEGGESLEDKLENIEHFYKRGVRIITLCWNYENNLGYGVLSKNKLGLKKFGKDVILKMNELDMIIDVSHLNEPGFWDVYNLTKKPFIASHSNSYSICKHIRNLNDDQLKAIAKVGGLVGINLYPHFLTENNKANLDSIFKHIDHISKIIGFNNISLGGDLDGIDVTPTEIKNVSDYEILLNYIEKKYGGRICEKISFKNAYDFFLT